MRRAMRPGIAVAVVLLVALTLVEPSSAATPKPGKKNPRMKVVKAFSSADTAGAVATATATCPKTSRPDLGPWRAISGGFQMKGVVPVFSTVNDPPFPPTGSGVVYESRKVGQRSWRVSAQSLRGTFSLKIFLYCQNGVPKTTHASTTVATPGTGGIGPATVARCRSGKTVSGGFSTPPPFTAGGAANTVIGSRPTGKRGWEAQVVSKQASSLTSYVYCAMRRHVRLRHSLAGEPSSVASFDLTQAFANASDCPVGRFLPGGGGFSEEGLTDSQYLIPVDSHEQNGGIGWHVNAIKTGSGVAVRLRAHHVCG